ncbi:MAG: hypothetical protein ACRCVS_05800, partial [Fusobacteriaceae bacterium]
MEINLNNEIKLLISQEQRLSLSILRFSTKEYRAFIQKKLKNELIILSNENSESELNKFSYSDSTEESLKGYLHEQLSYLKIEKKLKETCIYIIENLDEKGYFNTGIKGQHEKKDIELAKKVIKSFDPVGVGAKDLKECLKLQLERNGVYNEVMYIIIENHLENIATKNIFLIADSLNISKEEVERYISIIRKLNPTPSNGFSSNYNCNYIVPEAEIKFIEGSYKIIFDSKIYPNILLKNKTVEIELNKTLDKNKKDIIRSSERRKKTIQMILEIIIEKQFNNDGKLKKNIEKLQIKDIALELEMNNSTISRAVKEKYIRVYNGIRSMCSFITSKDCK